jgi:hypothetical protein
MGRILVSLDLYCTCTGLVNSGPPASSRVTFWGEKSSRVRVFSDLSMVSMWDSLMSRISMGKGVFSIGSLREARAANARGVVVGIGDVRAARTSIRHSCSGRSGFTILVDFIFLN